MATRFVFKTSPVKDRAGNVIGYRVGRTNPLVDDTTVFLGSVYAALVRRTEKLALALEERHLQDDVIETAVHESLHQALNEIEPYGSYHTGLSEEQVVDTLTQYVLEDVRSRPRLVPRDLSSDIRKEVLSGRATVARRPLTTHVQMYRRQR